jgi:hypothetical protein
VKVAGHLSADPDHLLAPVGKIPSDVKEAIIQSNGYAVGPGRSGRRCAACFRDHLNCRFALRARTLISSLSRGHMLSFADVLRVRVRSAGLADIHKDQAISISIPRARKAFASASEIPESVTKAWISSSDPRRVKLDLLTFVESATR